MSNPTLRAKVIRLALASPGLQNDLLPLLAPTAKQASEALGLEDLDFEAQALKSHLDKLEASISRRGKGWWKPLFQWWWYVGNNRYIKHGPSDLKRAAQKVEDLVQPLKNTMSMYERAFKRGRLVDSQGKTLVYQDVVQEAWDSRRRDLVKAINHLIDTVSAPVGRG